MDDIRSRIDDEQKVPVRYDEGDCPMEWGAAPEDEVPFEIPRD
jgi:hypothetical protein